MSMCHAIYAKMREIFLTHNYRCKELQELTNYYKTTYAFLLVPPSPLSFFSVLKIDVYKQLKL